MKNGWIEKTAVLFYCFSSLLCFIISGSVEDILVITSFIVPISGSLTSTSNVVFICHFFSSDIDHLLAFLKPVTPVIKNMGGLIRA